MRPRRRRVRAVLEAARERGELPAGLDLDAVVDMLIGSYYAQHLAGEPVAADWPAALIDTLLPRHPTDERSVPK